MTTFCEWESLAQCCLWLAKATLVGKEWGQRPGPSHYTMLSHKIEIIGTPKITSWPSLILHHSGSHLYAILQSQSIKGLINIWGEKLQYFRVCSELLLVIAILRDLPWRCSVPLFSLQMLNWRTNLEQPCNVSWKARSNWYYFLWHWVTFKIAL